MHDGAVIGPGHNQRVQKGSATLLFGIPKIAIGENRGFVGDEDLLRARGVALEILQDPDCIALMRGFIAARPELWDEDIGTVS